jgi:hypothetical protein
MLMKVKGRWVVAAALIVGHGPALVWAQQEVPDFTLQVGDVIAVRRGVLGALWMVSPSGRDQVRVQRIK